MRLLFPAIPAILGLMTACTPPQAPGYTPPQASGLVPVRPYPTAIDVCQVVGESAATSNYLDHTAILIACPNHEQGAIADRVAEGGVVVGMAGDWTLISIPQG